MKSDRETPRSRAACVSSRSTSGSSAIVVTLLRTSAIKIKMTYEEIPDQASQALFALVIRSKTAAMSACI
jgi:hypothetical protein